MKLLRLNVDGDNGKLRQRAARVERLGTDDRIAHLLAEIDRVVPSVNGTWTCDWGNAFSTSGRGMVSRTGSMMRSPA